MWVWLILSRSDLSAIPTLTAVSPIGVSDLVAVTTPSSSAESRPYENSGNDMMFARNVIRKIDMLVALKLKGKTLYKKRKLFK